MRFSIEEKNEGMRYVVAAFVFYFALVSFYINIGEDMTPANYLPWLLPVIGALVLFQYGARKRLFSLNHAPHLFAGVLWCVTFPLLYSWSYATPWYVSLIRLDFLCGTGIFLLLASWQSLVFSYGKLSRPVAALFAALDFACLAIPFVQIVYFSIYQHCLTPASLMALYLTNWHEAGDYIESTVGTVPAVLITLGLLALVYLSYRSFCALGRSIYPAAEGTRMGALLLVMIIAAAVHITLIPECSIAGVYKDVTDYVEQTQTYGLHRDERYDSLIIDRENTLAARAPGTVIFIIGESASRDYMHIYTPGFPYDDTPWMEEMTKNPGFILYQNTYSSWTQTVPVLERALTEKSQYNDKEFFESASILDVAKKIGYKTYWFSNQGRYGQFDSAITMVAKTADEAEWTDDSYTFTSKYDEELLPYLTRIDPHANNFIVLHLMGSHIYYNNRYPGEWAKFESAAGDSTMTSAPSYANSVLYTDHILKEIFDYAQKNLNLRAMVYFSDHGENLKISHNPDVFKFDMVKIPFFIYLSPEYRAAFPRRSEILASRREAYFTNDMMYDTVCGLLGAPSNRYDPLRVHARDAHDHVRDAPPHGGHRAADLRRAGRSTAGKIIECKKRIAAEMR